TVISLVYLGAFVLLNALPETIYQKYYGPVDTISYSFNFLTENVLNWAIPNIIYFLLLYPILPNIMNIVLMISFGTIPSPTYIITFFVGQLIFNFGMIYRGHLFEVLSTSTKRKREFMKKF